MLRTQDKRLFLDLPTSEIIRNHESVLPLVTIGALTSGTTDGTQATAAGSTNTKGNWAEISSSCPIDADGFWMGMSHGNTITSPEILIDIGIGAEGAEVVVLENYLLSGFTNFRGGHSVYIPLRLIAGTRVAVRCQASVASTTARVTLALMRRRASLIPGFSVALTYGANTADSGGTSVDPGGSANTKGVYSELSAGVTNRTRALLIGIGGQNNASRVNARWLLDIATGAESAETVIIPNLLLSTSTSSEMMPHVMGPFAVDIPSGTRLAARTQTTITDATDRVFDVTAIGFN